MGMSRSSDPSDALALPCNPDPLTRHTGRGGFTLGARGVGSIEGGIEEQAQTVLESLERDLAGAGLGWGEVLYVGVYLRTLGDFAKVRGLRYFRG